MDLTYSCHHLGVTGQSGHVMWPPCGGGRTATTSRDIICALDLASKMVKESSELGLLRSATVLFLTHTDQEPPNSLQSIVIIASSVLRPSKPWQVLLPSSSCCASVSLSDQKQYLGKVQGVETKLSCRQNRCSTTWPIPRLWPRFPRHNQRAVLSFVTMREWAKLMSARGTKTGFFLVYSGCL